MYGSFLDMADQVESINNEPIEGQTTILRIRIPNHMWIKDYAIDLHMRNLIATYGDEALFESIDRLMKPGLTPL